MGSEEDVRVIPRHPGHVASARTWNTCGIGVTFGARGVYLVRRPTPRVRLPGRRPLPKAETKMKETIAVFALLLPISLLAACDEPKKDAPDAAASAPASSAPSAAVAPAVASAPPAETAPPASSASMLTGDAKDVVLTMKDPTKEPEKTVKTQAGGSLTVFLPDYPGTVWSLEASDKALGKAKEEVIPGFAPQTNGHQFKWGTLPKAGKYKATLVNKKVGPKGGPPVPAEKTWTLLIDVA